MPPKLTGMQHFKKHWYAVEVLPIYAVALGAVCGATWYLSRLARGPDVIWDKRGNPTPWNSIKENQQVKLHAVNHKYDGEAWRREKL